MSGPRCGLTEVVCVGNFSWTHGQRIFQGLHPFTLKKKNCFKLASCISNWCERRVPIQRHLVNELLPFSSSLLLLFRKTTRLDLWNVGYFLFSQNCVIVEPFWVLVKLNEVKLRNVIYCGHCTHTTTTLWCFRNDKTGNKWGAELEKQIEGGTCLLVSVVVFRTTRLMMAHVGHDTTTTTTTTMQFIIQEGKENEMRSPLCVVLGVVC